MTSGIQGRDIAIIVIVVLVVLLLGGGMMGFGMMAPWMIGMMSGIMNPWWGVAMLVFWLLIIGGIALLFMWILKQAETKNTAVGVVRKSEAMPLEIVKTRYARGEITKEQYEQLRRDLE